MHEVEAPAPGHQLNAVKKEEASDDRADLDSLCTTPPGSPGEEVKCEPEDEYPLGLTPTLHPQNMPTVTSHHQRNHYGPQQPTECVVALQPFEPHVVAGTGTNDVISQPHVAPLAEPTPNYACFEQQRTWPHTLPAFSPYFGIDAAQAIFPSTTSVECYAGHRPVTSQPITAPSAPPLASPAPRLATPRDLVTPFASEHDYGATADGSIVFGSTATGVWNLTTSGGTYGCPECGYIAADYDLLRWHHNAWHGANSFTEL